jgi:hypothetical protein
VLQTVLRHNPDYRMGLQLSRTIGAAGCVPSSGD